MFSSVDCNLFTKMLYCELCFYTLNVNGLRRLVEWSIVNLFNVTTKHCFTGLLVYKLFYVMNLRV